MACSAFHYVSLRSASNVPINNLRNFDKATGYIISNERELMSYPGVVYKLWLKVTLLK